jgi:nicotinamidase-related amidase
MATRGYALLVVDMQNGFCHPDGGEACDELGCGPDDLVVDKVRFDAFQWTSLEPLLRGLGVTDLMICGVVTNICVETTARSAFMRDFPVTLLEDCCAAKTRRLSSPVMASA